MPFLSAFGDDLCFCSGGGRTFCRGNRDWIRETRSIGGLASGVVSRIREFVEVYRDRGSNAVKRASNACVVGEKNQAQRSRRGNTRREKEEQDGKAVEQEAWTNEEASCDLHCFFKQRYRPGRWYFPATEGVIQEIGRISPRVVYRNGFRQ